MPNRNSPRQIHKKKPPQMDRKKFCINVLHDYKDGHKPYADKDIFEALKYFGDTKLPHYETLRDDCKKFVDYVIQTFFHMCFIPIQEQYDQKSGLYTRTFDPEEYLKYAKISLIENVSDQLVWDNVMYSSQIHKVLMTIRGWLNLMLRSFYFATWWDFSKRIDESDPSEVTFHMVQFLPFISEWYKFILKTYIPILEVEEAIGIQDHEDLMEFLQCTPDDVNYVLDNISSTRITWKPFDRVSDIPPFQKYLQTVFRLFKIKKISGAKTDTDVFLELTSIVEKNFYENRPFVLGVLFRDLHQCGSDTSTNTLTEFIGLQYSWAARRGIDSIYTDNSIKKIQDFLEEICDEYPKDMFLALKRRTRLPSKKWISNYFDDAGVVELMEFLGTPDKIEIGFQRFLDRYYLPKETGALYHEDVFIFLVDLTVYCAISFGTPSINVYLGFLRFLIEHIGSLIPHPHREENTNSGLKVHTKLENLIIFLGDRVQEFPEVYLNTTTPVTKETTFIHNYRYVSDSIIWLQEFRGIGCLYQKHLQVAKDLFDQFDLKSNNNMSGHLITLTSVHPENFIIDI